MKTKVTIFANNYSGTVRVFYGELSQVPRVGELVCVQGFNLRVGQVFNIVEENRVEISADTPYKLKEV